MVAVIAPWTYHNWRTYHRFLPLTISAGALWYGSPEFYHLTQRQRSFLDIWGNELKPQRNGGYDPHTIRVYLGVFGPVGPVSENPELLVIPGFRDGPLGLWTTRTALSIHV
jgi:hypothetical protein